MPKKTNDIEAKLDQALQRITALETKQDRLIVAALQQTGDWVYYRLYPLDHPPNKPSPPKRKQPNKPNKKHHK